MLYWYHRLFHIPFLYKWSHKVHHQFKQPTAYAGLATHPVEFLGALVISGSQFFLFPVHWGEYGHVKLFFNILTKIFRSYNSNFSHSTVLLRAVHANRSLGSGLQRSMVATLAIGYQIPRRPSQVHARQFRKPPGMVGSSM